MSWNLYLVRFKGGEPDTVPLAEATVILEQYGTLSGSANEFELLPSPSDEEIGFQVRIDRESGWVTVERPRDTAVFRRFVFDLLTKLGMTGIDPSGGPVLIADIADPSDLPHPYNTKFERISSPNDVWG